MMKEKIFSNIPNHKPIELVEYYDEFLWYYPNCEMETKKWCVNNIKDNWTILDCGANIGYYSILFSELSTNGKVYAFEPTETFDKLIKNIKHNNCKNIVPLKIAVGDKTGEFCDGIFRIWGNDAEYKEYPFTTIDDYIKKVKMSKVDLIKIDVDSYDFEVLKGAKNTLLNFNPIVIVELNHALSKRNQTSIEAMKWLIDLGYKEAIVTDNDNFIFQKHSELYNTYRNDNSITLHIL